MNSLNHGLCHWPQSVPHWGHFENVAIVADGRGGGVSEIPPLQTWGRSQGQLWNDDETQRVFLAGILTLLGLSNRLKYPTHIFTYFWFMPTKCYRNLIIHLEDLNLSQFFFEFEFVPIFGTECIDELVYNEI